VYRCPAYVVETNHADLVRERKAVTLRERMRRRGWAYRPWCDWYEKNIDGVIVQLWPHLMSRPPNHRVKPIQLEFACIVIGNDHEEQIVTRHAREGLPSLAQRARALVRGRRQ